MFLLYMLLAVVFVGTVGLSAYLGTRSDTQHEAVKNELSGVSPTTVPVSGNFILRVDMPVSGSVVASTSAVVRGFTIPSAKVRVGEKEFSSDVKGNFVGRADLVAGENTILVVVTNEIGEQVEKKIEVRVPVLQ